MPAVADTVMHVFRALAYALDPRSGANLFDRVKAVGLVVAVVACWVLAYTGYWVAPDWVTEGLYALLATSLLFDAGHYYGAKDGAYVK